MSVPSGTARERYIGTGTTGPFAFNYKLYDATHVTVAKTSLAGIDTYLTLNTDYTVSLAADMSSATISTVLPVAGDGIDDGGSEILTIVRDPPVSQLVEWPRSDPFPSATHERAADLAVMLIGRLNEKIERSLLLPESSVFSGLTLPNPVALNVLRWNASETALENVVIDASGTLVVSPFMVDVLDEVNAAAVRSKLGLGSIALLNSIATANLDNNAVTYAKMQQVSAEARVLGRNQSAGVGNVQEMTRSNVLDMGGASQGLIIYRGASTWDNLAPGSSGQHLRTNGAGQNPAWENQSYHLLAAGTVINQATLDLVLTSFTAFQNIKIFLQSFVPATDDVELRMRTSTNGGSSYDSGASDYAYVQRGFDSSGAARGGTSSALDFIVIAGEGTAAASVSNVAGDGGANCELVLQEPTSNIRFGSVLGDAGWYAPSNRATQVSISGNRVAVQNVDAVRFYFEAGNIAQGIYRVYGLM